MPSPYLLAILGAKEFPQPFASDPAFELARDALKEALIGNLSVSDKDLLDLFDSDLSANDQDVAFGQFIRERVRANSNGGQAPTLIVYYVGHGAFSGQDFYFAVRRTRRENPLMSSLLGKGLVETIRREAMWTRTCALLDACFSGELAKLFLSDVPEAAARPFLRRGVSLLCSAPSELVSYLLPDRSGTAFTDGVVAALKEGCPAGRAMLTLRQLGGLTAAKIEQRKHELGQWLGAQAVADYDPPRPQIHTPQAQEGDLADEPLFLNAGWNTSTHLQETQEHSRDGFAISRPLPAERVRALVETFVGEEDIRLLELNYGPEAVLDGIMGLWPTSNAIDRARMCHAAGLLASQRARSFLVRVLTNPEADKIVRYHAGESLRRMS
jgi:hypothetical protein